MFRGGSWKVIKGAMIVAQDRKVGTLYMTSESRDTISVADSSVDSKLWHRRLGHMSEKGMKLLASKGKLPDLKSVDAGLCEDCIYGIIKELVSQNLQGHQRQKSYSWCTVMYGGQPQYDLLAAHATMSPLLMIPLERYGFIFLRINLRCLLLLRSEKQK